MPRPTPSQRPAGWTQATLRALAAMLLLGAATPVPAEEYVLGAQDRIRLKIFEWRASRDAIFEWSALNDEFAVGPDGTLAIPFVGVIAAAGQTPGALAGKISERLVYQMGLGHAPDVSVELIAFRPFYIVGHVLQAGEYPYRPALTVLQALSIAGGLRTRLDDDVRLEREMIAGRGEIGLLSLETVGLLARRARLEAELAGAPAIDFPPDLADHAAEGTAAVLLDQERTIFEARREGLATQVRALESLRSFLERETDALERQVGFLDDQIASVQAELATVASLVDQGLAVAPRQLALERALLQVRSDRLAAETAHLRANQEIGRTDIAILELRTRDRNEVSVALRDTQDRLDQTDRRTDTALRLLEETAGLAPRMRALRAEAALAEPRFSIVRPGKGGPVEFAAAEDTPVRPGDTIKVALPLLSVEEVAPSAGTGPEAAAPAAATLPVSAGAAAAAPIPSTAAP